MVEHQAVYVTGVENFQRAVNKLFSEGWEPIPRTQYISYIENHRTFTCYVVLRREKPER